MHTDRKQSFTVHFMTASLCWKRMLTIWSESLVYVKIQFVHLKKTLRPTVWNTSQILLYSKGIAGYFKDKKER
jgi:hypothetical protein